MQIKTAASAEYQTFRVVAHMKTPAILQGELTLESLLASCVYEQTGKMKDEALSEVPIEVMDTPDGKIWLASSAMFDGRVKMSEHIVIRGRHFAEMGPEFYDPNLRARIDGWAINQESGLFTKLLTPYTAYEVSRLVWYAKGNMRQCQSLLATQGWLGKRRGSGFGEVSEIKATTWEGNPLLDTRGMVRRPIALKRLAHVHGALPHAQQRVVSAVDTHPAWFHQPELCAVPPTKKEAHAISSEGDAEMFFG